MSAVEFDVLGIPAPMVHICRPATLYVRGLRTCPDCKKYCRWAGFEQIWYGLVLTCLNCGRHFSDGQWMPLPFERQARQNSIKRARAMWADAVGWRGPEARTWVREQLGVA